MKECKTCGNLFLNTEINFKKKKTYRINQHGEKTFYTFLSLHCLGCEKKYKWIRKPKEEIILKVNYLKRLGFKDESYFTGDFGECDSLRKLLNLKEINE